MVVATDRIQEPIARVAVDQDDVTALLSAWRAGDHRALERLVPLMYRDLRRIAGSYMRSERADHTWQPTVLVHEALLRVLAQDSRSYRDRGHFLAMMATMMRRVLIDHARRRLRIKHGGGIAFVPLSDAAGSNVAGPDVACCPGVAPSRQLLAVDQALRALAEVDAQQAKLVELRFFAGLSVEETATVLGVSSRTIKRRWRTARTWLYDHLSRHQSL